MTAAPVDRLGRSRATRWAALSGLTAAALLALTVLALTVALPMVTGGAARSVRSGSMAPAIPQGALVLDRPVREGDLRVGDVVTYGLDTGSRRILVTHRIVAVDRSVTPALLTLRGDANRTEDAARVPADAVRGRVWLVVPWLGGLRQRVVDLRWPLATFVAVGAAAYLWAARATRRPREGAP